ncbi:hypothetical protein [Mesotoga sp. Brook.08.YT.4.2.5.1]|nr:hypothetical protein [Mesotoga sp. Brook.08.YT.4.2.5.1]
MLKYMYERVGGVAPSDFSDRGIRGLWRFIDCCQLVICDLL